MTVTVPPRLVKRATAATFDAFLLRDVARLPAAVLGLGPTPPAVFRVDGGFLLVPADDPPERLPAAVSLRRLAGDLYVPADADLVPTLLPDELAALTREVGLVVLPGGAVLGFAANHPLAPADWLQVPAVERGDWQPLPDPEPLANHLTVIEMPAPEVVVDDLLDEGAPDDRDPLGGPGQKKPIPEDARPPAGGPIKSLMAGAQLTAGKLLNLFGTVIRSGALAAAGAGLAARAVSKVPRLSEKILGAQEAALRELLRQLQGGDVEKALKRAPAAVADPAEASGIDTGSSLGHHDTRYSLSALFGGRGRGSVWLGGGDVWALLATEYRRLAMAALARGDHRRAAYIYGVLLRDLNAAAAVLMQGGLYRDAARLYRDKLNQPDSAAQCFQQACDFDEAVRLYIKAEKHEAAGDLLLRLGLMEPAAEQFTVAAERLAKTGRWVAAGDLLRTKIGEPAATGLYRRGWDAAGVESVVCGERLYDQLLVVADWPGTSAFLDEAEEQLQPPRTADAGRFFNHARHAGADRLPADLKADLDDQTRLLFAAHLREQPKAAGKLFTDWPGPVTRDALFATRGTEKPTETSTAPTIQLTDGTVVAVAAACVVPAVAVATSTAVVVWRPEDGRVWPVCRVGERPVVGLAITNDGERVYVLQADGDDLLLGQHVISGDRVTFRGQRRFTGVPPRHVRLHPPVGEHLEIDLGAERLVLDPQLMNRPVSEEMPTDDWRVVSGEYEWAVQGNMLMCRNAAGDDIKVWATHWRPSWPAGSSLVVPVVDWIADERRLEMAGVDRDGALHWGRWEVIAGDDRSHGTATDLAGYRGACLTAAGRVAAVTGGNHVRWLRAIGGMLDEPSPATRLQVPSPAVAVVALSGAEVAVIFADGAAVRVPVPG